MAYVLTYSPYRGATFLVHVMIGDTANDAHDDELWMSQSYLANKARLSRRQTQEAVYQLTNDGWLTLIEDNSRRGKPNRYRFEYPQVPQVWPEGVRSECAPGAQSSATGCAATAHKLNKNSNEPLGQGAQSVRTPVDRSASPVGPFIPGSGAIHKNRDCPTCEGVGAYVPEGSDAAVDCPCKGRR